MNKLKEVIALTFAYYNNGRVPQDTVIAMYAEDLADLPQDLCITAYSKYRRNPKNKTFPLPAAIREIVCPEDNISIEAQAREIAARICGAIPKFGWCNQNEAMNHIGPAGWQTVERQGGWNYICQNMGININPTSFQAQIRDQIAANLQYGSLALEAKIHSLPSPTGLMQLGEIMKHTLKSVEPDENNG